MYQVVKKRREGDGAGVCLDGDPTGFLANAMIVSVTLYHRCIK